MNALDRFMKKVEKTDACWLWTAHRTPQGYGRFGFENRNCLAHRASWSLFRGSIPAGLQVLHSCDTPACVNPRHLFLGTNADNVADKVAKGRQLSLRGTENGRARLTESDVMAIRDAVARGIPRQELARAYAVVPPYINQIAARRCWRHI